jgi:glycosyltransferase involved in cell wall biosynthesis
MKILKRVLKTLKVYKSIITLYDYSSFNIEFFTLTRKIKQSNFKNSTVFFFPYVHTGGAEKVHLNIVKSVSNKSNYTFITKSSYNNQFLNDFNAHSSTFVIDKFLKKPKFHKRLKKILSKKVSLASNVFGSNTEFFYQLLDNLPNTVLKSDLIHAFVYPDIENGAEFYSLPYVDKLDTRIVINKKTELDLTSQYKENNIHDTYIDKIKTIYNGINLTKSIPDKYQAKTLKVLYVGRNTQEKRVDLIRRIADKLTDHPFIKFYAIGEGLDSFFTKSKNVSVLGVKSGKELTDLYLTSHCLLLTSKREGFPMVISEAMTNGVTVLSTNVGGIPYVLKDEKNAILIDSINEDAIVTHFSNKLIEFNNSRVKLKEMSIAGKNTVDKIFSIDSFEKQYQNLFK